ncbi:NrfD/PsrC family molybdoenzyme membrane anchor subunit [candidate division CSSED10-310 bacterium]|uniref:NrfD/PsrC family molybdoenzyme membrane anchor subunit n=1 Tax=candidate division CSSED10-310 bacterium TaxID=2855610 RepID=A0ABV6Z430_UNCC1
MTEIEITSGRFNEYIDPNLHIWGLDVAIYLFLGGLAAGLMVIPSLRLLMNNEKQNHTTTALPLLLVSVLMSVGMFCLFLDLHYKFHVFRFYTAFQPRSPMSWGAWILIFVYPISFLLGISRLKNDYPTLGKYTLKFDSWLAMLKKFEQPLAYMNIVFGVALGIYTGILLSAYVARPLWNSGLLGVLFLTSGLSTGAALLILLTPDHEEGKLLSKLDVVLLAAEIGLIVILFVNMFTSSIHHKAAARLFFGGPYTASFWTLVVGVGLVAPFLLETFELKGKRVPLVLPALLVLGGGFMLRVILLSAGQASTFLPY